MTLDCDKVQAYMDVTLVLVRAVDKRNASELIQRKTF